MSFPVVDLLHVIYVSFNRVLVCNKSRCKTFQLAVVIKYHLSIHNIPRISAMYFIYFSLFLVLLALMRNLRGGAKGLKNINIALLIHNLTTTGIKVSNKFRRQHNIHNFS